MFEKNTILVVEDDRNVALVIQNALADAGYLSRRVSNGTDAIAAISRQLPNLFILDIGLPDIDGLELLRRIRQMTRRPVIIVSAHNREREKVLALDMGADDYVTKPFGRNELLARIRSALRHYSMMQEDDIQLREPYTCGDLVVDLEKQRVLLAGEPVKLTPSEYQILALLAQSYGNVVTYKALTTAIWGPYADDSCTRTLRVNMANIRRKIERNPGKPQYIITEIGIGYRIASR